MRATALWPSFDYGISRVYPWKWFTWLVISGGVLLATLFSALNVAAVGYNLELQITTDPNTTMSRSSWTNSVPFSWFDKLKSVCQPQAIQVGSRFFTNQQGLHYTVEAVLRTQPDGSQMSLPSLRYMNNTLDSCTIYDMYLDIERKDGRTVSQFNTLRWGAEAILAINCTINNDFLPTTIQLSLNYDYVSRAVNGEKLLNINRTNGASLWWGQSLLGWYYMKLVNAFDELNGIVDGNADFLRVSAARFASRPYATGSSNTNLTSILFFGNQSYLGEVWSFICQKEDPNGRMNPYMNICSGTDNHFANTMENMDSGVWPWSFVWQQAHDYGVTLYSVVMGDLGNNETANVLTDPEILQYYTAQFDSSDKKTEYVPDPPTNQSYKELRDSTGPLGINAATIFAQYFCQVPKLQSTGSLIMAVFIADLVFLSAAWTILKAISTWWIETHDKNAMKCVGCLELTSRLEDLQQSLVKDLVSSPSQMFSPDMHLRPLIARKPLPMTDIVALNQRHPSYDQNEPLLMRTR